MYLQVWKLGFKQTSWRGDWGEGSGAATAQHASCEHIECKLRQNHGAKVSLDVVIMLVSLFFTAWFKVYLGLVLGLFRVE